MTLSPSNLPALVLAAGRGDRMRPLSDATPKPLLEVGGRPMIEWHLLALARAGVRDVVINTAWLEEQFEPKLGDGSRFGVTIHWSHERRDHGGALETAGGIATALPLLGPAFWVVSGDIVCPDFGFDAADARRFLAGDDLAELWLVPNPPYHPLGDFGLEADGRATRPANGSRPWTYANIALARADLVDGVRAGERAPLAPCLFAAAAAGRLGGRVLQAPWANVGTPVELERARTMLSGAIA